MYNINKLNLEVIIDKPEPPKYVVHDCDSGDTFIADNMIELKEWINEAVDYGGTGVEHIKVFRIGEQLDVSKKLIIK